MTTTPGDAVMDEVANVLGWRPTRVGRTPRGESRSTFVLTGPGPARAVLKVAGGGGEALANHRRLVAIVERLRARGYPAPEYLGVGAVENTVFTLARLVDGATLEEGPGSRPDPDMFARLLPALVDAVELQAGAGDLDHPPWPERLLATLTHGGDGYCLHDTMRRRPDTTALLARIQKLALRNTSVPVASGDVVHFDMNPANIVHRGGRLAAVVDWSVPFTGAAQGDRGFDLATLCFYAYDVPAVRDELWDRLVDTSGMDWAAVYLAHLCLRQVEWTLRHRPGGAEEDRFMAIARAVLDRCEAAGA